MPTAITQEVLYFFSDYRTTVVELANSSSGKNWWKKKEKKNSCYMAFQFVF